MDEPCSFTWGLYIFHFSKDGKQMTIRHGLQPGEEVRVDIGDFSEAMNRALELHGVVYSSNKR